MLSSLAPRPQIRPPSPLTIFRCTLEDASVSPSSTSLDLPTGNSRTCCLQQASFIDFASKPTSTIPVRRPRRAIISNVSSPTALASRLLRLVSRARRSISPNHPHRPQPTPPRPPPSQKLTMKATANPQEVPLLPARRRHSSLPPIARSPATTTTQASAASKEASTRRSGTKYGDPKTLHCLLPTASTMPNSSHSPMPASSTASSSNG